MTTVQPLADAGTVAALARHSRLVAALANPGCYPHPVGRVEVEETHISSVLLTGAYAYKIKKPVDLGFLDYSTLERRHALCMEELRLNFRMAPQLYLDVVPITGSELAPHVDGAGPPIEYAVRMRQFDRGRVADHLARSGALTPECVSALAVRIADMHRHSPRATVAADGFGSPARVLRDAMANFGTIRTLAPDANLDALERWTREQHALLATAFLDRLRAKWVRECHGDLHLGNIVVLRDGPQPFDCIEFDPGLRWIDVMNEIAFVMMDLMARGQGRLAARFLDAYLQDTGDYDGLRMLRFYLVYRAMVRAKVALLKVREAGEAEVDGGAGLRRHLDFATQCLSPRRACLVITHGLSGSGKTTLAQPLLEALHAVRLRSDVERKRLRGLPGGRGARAAVDEGAYREDVTAATYARLLDLARGILEAGYPVVVDATFLHRNHRDAFRALAQANGVPFAILDLDAPVATLRERIGHRLRVGSDASDADLAVLEHQLATREPLRPDERDCVVALDAACPVDAIERSPAWVSLVARLGQPAG